MCWSIPGSPLCHPQGTHPANWPSARCPHPGHCLQSPRLSACCRPCCHAWSGRTGEGEWALLPLRQWLCLLEEMSLGFSSSSGWSLQLTGEIPPSPSSLFPKLQGKLQATPLHYLPVPARELPSASRSPWPNPDQLGAAEAAKTEGTDLAGRREPWRALLGSLRERCCRTLMMASFSRIWA